MDLSGFKIMFKISQTTDSASELVVFNIRSKLREEGYEIVTLKDKSLSFKFPPFKFVWSYEAPYILSGGVFKVMETKEGTVVNLEYFIDMLYSLLLFAFLAIVLIIEDFYWGILFFGAFFLVTSIFQYFTTKNVGRRLLNSILTENESDF